MPRVEDARLLTGHGTYVDDIDLPGMLHACFVRSPVAHAEIRNIDTAAACAAPGVRAVFTAAELNGDVKEQWHTSVGRQSPETPRPPLAEGRVRFVGDPVALVIAESRYLAEDAIELVEVDYEPLPSVADYTRAHEAAALVHESHGSNLIGEMAGAPMATLEEAFAAAAHVVTETIYQNAYVPVPMEGRGLVVDYSPAMGELTIYAATQAPHEVRLFCSRLLGLPEQRIRVVMRDTGGAFGQKIMVQRDEMCLMLVAPKMGVPVKWVEDRRENLISAGQSRHEHGAVRMAFDTDGAILAAAIDFVSDCGAYPTPWPVGTAGVVGMLLPGPYRVPKASFTAKTFYTNTVGRAAYRGPWQFETLARELLLDIAARRIGIDPMQLRRRNLLREDELPYTNPNGLPYDSIAPLATFEQALEMLDYEGFRREQAQARAAGRYLGVGLSTYVEPSTPSFGYYATEAATIRVEPSGKVNVLHCRRVCGQQHRDHCRAARRRRARRAHRRRRDDPGGHRSHRLRRGSRRKPERIHDRWRDRGGGGDVAGTDRGHRGAQAGGFAGRHRAGRQPGQRAGRPVGRSLAGRHRGHGLLRAGLVAPRRAGRPGNQRPLHQHDAVRVGQRHAPVHVRGGCRHRPGAVAALHRQRGLRPDDQPERRGGADRRRDRTGDRRGAVREPGLRRGRQSDDDYLRRLPAADLDGGAGDRVRPRRDPQPRSGRLQGRG